MARDEDGLLIDAKTGDLNRRIGFDFRAAFVKLTKFAVDAVALNPAAFADAAELAAAIKVETPVELRAWVLIRRALGYAMAKIAAETLGLGQRRPGDAKSLIETLDLSLEDTPILVNSRFFQFPADLPVVERTKRPLRQWLEAFGVEPDAAVRACHDLGARFTRALDREWGRRPEDYEPIKKAIDTPFTRGSERERAWLTYRTFVDAQLDEPIFGETFGLRAVYIPLRAYYRETIEGHRDDHPGQSSDPDGRSRRVIVDLETAISSWLAGANRRDAIRIVCGGPGSGKSSFAKHLSARVARESGKQLLFIPLHQFELGTDLVTAVGQFAKRAQLLDHNPLDVSEQGDRRVLLVFDGLDELAMLGRTGQEAVADFLGQLRRALDHSNFQRLCIQVLICGREIVVQQNERSFELSQIYNVLPYSITDEWKEGSYREDGASLAVDQRDDWWRSYGKAKGTAPDGMPAALRRPDLDEVTAQPLLNYLLALSREYAGAAADEEAASDLNAIYARLLGSVWKRRWGDRQLPDVQALSERDFQRVFEDIALAGWQSGDSRVVGAETVRRLCEESGLAMKLAAFEQNAERGAVSLLAAFFARQAGFTKAGERTFEFTHKTFAEYLISCRLVRAVRGITAGLAARDEDPDAPLDDRGALTLWARLCGPAPMDEDLYGFLAREVAREQDGTVREWQWRLAQLLGFVCRHGWPMERLAEQAPRFADQQAQARNAEESLLAAHHACGARTHVTSSPVWPDDKESPHSPTVAPS